MAVVVTGGIVSVVACPLRSIPGLPANSTALTPRISSFTMGASQILRLSLAALCLLGAPVLADECQPVTWTRKFLAVGSINCRFSAKTALIVDLDTCAQLASKNDITVADLLGFNPRLACDAILPDTRYCVEGCKFSRTLPWTLAELEHLWPLAEYCHKFLSRSVPTMVSVVPITKTQLALVPTSSVATRRAGRVATACKSFSTRSLVY